MFCLARQFSGRRAVLPPLARLTTAEGQSLLKSLNNRNRTSVILHQWSVTNCPAVAVKDACQSMDSKVFGGQAFVWLHGRSLVT